MNAVSLASLLQSICGTKETSRVHPELISNTDNTTIYIGDGAGETIQLYLNSNMDKRARGNQLGTSAKLDKSSTQRRTIGVMVTTTAGGRAPLVVYKIKDPLFTVFLTVDLGVYDERRMIIVAYSPDECTEEYVAKHIELELVIPAIHAENERVKREYCRHYEEKVNEGKLSGKDVFDVVFSHWREHKETIRDLMPTKFLRDALLRYNSRDYESIFGEEEEEEEVTFGTRVEALPRSTIISEVTVAFNHRAIQISTQPRKCPCCCSAE